MAIRVGKGRASVEITGAIAEQLEREVRDLLGPVADEMDAEADRILRDDIGKRWPVQSGDSLRAWRKVLRVIPGTWTVEVVLLNPMRRTRYIKTTRIGDGPKGRTRPRSPLQTEVRVPARKARKRLRDTLPGLLARALEQVAENKGDG